ncbi:hypothetical protein FBALC1_09652 [Flavobacteriales bacterium ALC-1]|nr:hypothetical protein FBALC1_09652 [Flavobacteriales bacterium ALC-1]
MKKDRIEDIYGDLGEFSKEPPKELWDNIEARLHPKKKKKRIFFLWGSAAAVLLVLIGYMLTDSSVSNSKPINEITDIEKSTEGDTINGLEKQNTKIVKGTNSSDSNNDGVIEESDITEELLKNVASQKQLSERNKILQNNKKNKAIVENINKKNKNEKEKKSKYNNSYSQNSVKEKNDKVNNKDMAALQKKNKTVNYVKDKVVVYNDSISKVKDVSLLDINKELMTKNENDRDSTNINKEVNSKWSVEVLAGLTNTSSPQSSIQNASVNTVSQNDFVYAFKLGYSISDKLVVKSGIGKNILGQEVNGVKYISSATTLSAGNSQNIISNQDILFLASQEAINDFSTNNEIINEGTLLQQLDYIQVPIELSYRVVAGEKYDVSLGVGGNVNFLTDNSVFLNDEHIGENLGVNTTVFGATLNSSISYKLAKKMILFLEPSYNYFEKPIDNNNQTFNNNQFRVLFGLRYKL